MLHATAFLMREIKIRFKVIHDTDEAMKFTVSSRISVWTLAQECLVLNF